MPTATLRKDGSAIQAETDDGQAFRVKATLRDLGPLMTELRASGYTIKADKAAAEIARRWIARQEGKQPPVRVKDSWGHQLGAYHFAYHRPATMLNMHMGTGKTKVAVDLMQNWPDVKRTLVVCPASVRTTWLRQLVDHGAVPFRAVELSKGTRRNVQLASSELGFQETTGERLVLITNYEAFWRDDLFDLLRHQARLDLVIWDEIHRLKSPGGKAARRADLLRGSVPRRLGLTGTIMPHSPLDAYSQYRALDPEIFGTSVTAFRNRYAVMKRLPNIQVPIPVKFINQEDMRQRLSRITFEATADVLDLPPVTHETVEVELPGPAMRAYRELERDFYTEVEDGEITVANALVKVLRLQQVAAGHVPLDDGTQREVHSEKERALQDILQDLDEPVVVFCRFRTDLAAVHRAAAALSTKDAPRPSYELSGSRKELEEWQRVSTQEAAVLAVQIQSGGVGVDLTAARVGVYFTLTHSLGDYDQSLARIHRPGQERPVVYYHLVAVSTVDRKIRRALENRRDTIEEVLHGTE